MSSLCLAIICQICPCTNDYGAIFYFCVGRHRPLDHPWSSENVYDSLPCQIQICIGWACRKQSPIPKIWKIKWHTVLGMHLSSLNENAWCFTCKNFNFKGSWLSYEQNCYTHTGSRGRGDSSPVFLASHTVSGFFYPFAPFSGVHLKVDANDVQEQCLCGMASSSLYIMFCDIYV